MKNMVIVKANEQSEAGVIPGTGLLTKMMKHNEQLVKAGVMLTGEGLRPSSKGKRVKLAGNSESIRMGSSSSSKGLPGRYIPSKNTTFVVFSDL